MCIIICFIDILHVESDYAGTGILPRPHFLITRNVTSTLFSHIEWILRHTDTGVIHWILGVSIGTFHVFAFRFGSSVCALEAIRWAN